MDIRRVDLSSDLPLLQDFFLEVFEHEVASQVWTWKYHPPWSTDVYAWVGFVRGKMVMHAGAVHLRGTVKGMEAPFFQFGDIAVHPRHRGPLTLSYVNSVTDRIFQTVERQYPQHVYYGFTGRRPALLYQLKGGRVMEEACDRIFKVDTRIDLSGNLALRTLDWDSTAIDDIWKSMKPSTGIIRDRVYLDWRYVQHPQYGHRLLGVYQNDTLAGWLVLAENCFDGEEREEVRILDHLVPQELLPSMFSQVARVTNAQTVVFWHPDRLWNGESRKTNWLVICKSSFEGITSKQIAGDLNYGLGEVDQWWW